MELVAYIASLVIIAVTCLFGVFSCRFKDNIIQRIGLSMACSGATLRVYEMFTGAESHVNVRYLLTYGVALFALCTFYRFTKKCP